MTDFKNKNTDNLPNSEKSNSDNSISESENISKIAALENSKNDSALNPTDDPSQWTWLPNDPVTSEEMDLLLKRNNQFVFTPDYPHQNVDSRYEGFSAEDYENGKTVTNHKYTFPRENFKASDIRSSLLIPEKYLSIFRTKVIEHQGVRAYITYLLNKYRIHIANGFVPAYSNLTTKYQEKDQCLRKIGFRPYPSDWAELKLYRVSFGMSISAFLIYLLIADSTNFAQTLSNFLWKVGIPPVSILDLAAKLYLCQNRDYYTAIFQFRESDTY